MCVCVLLVFEGGRLSFLFACVLFVFVVVLFVFVLFVVCLLLFVCLLFCCFCFWGVYVFSWVLSHDGILSLAIACVVWYEDERTCC